MLTGGVAFRVAARGYLRHVDYYFDTGFLGSLRELSGRLHEAWADRIAEVGPLHSAQRGTHRVEIKEVAKHDLSASRPQLLRSLVGPMGDHTHGMPFLE
jgi:hypothetical protein